MAVTLEEPTATTASASDREKQRAAPAVALASPVVSVLIVTWNSAAWIERCLIALPDAFAGVDYEVIVHDNASSDHTVAVASALGDRRATIHSSSENSGFSGGLNRALRNAHGAYILCLNPDCEPAPESLRILVEYLDIHPELGGAVPLLVDDAGVPQRDFQLRRLPTVGSLAAEILLVDRLFPRNRVTSRYRYRDLDIESPQDIEQPAAAALMIRRSVIDDVGHFDESFAPAWFEDVDYSMRLARKRHTIRLVPQARAKHRGGASLEHVSFDDFLQLWYRNLFRYATKWFPARQVELLRWVIIAGMLLRSAAARAGLSKLPSEREAKPRTYLKIAGDAFRRWKPRGANE